MHKCLRLQRHKIQLRAEHTKCVTLADFMLSETDDNEGYL
jgi:hypothetical protein